jgi:hypothetical protein
LAAKRRKIHKRKTDFLTAEDAENAKEQIINHLSSPLPQWRRGIGGRIGKRREKGKEQLVSGLTCRCYREEKRVREV